MSAASQIAAISESLTCPITQDIMKDPVTGSDGHTYERSAIETWLAHRGTSPLCPNEHMHASSLKTNTGIRYLCDKYHQGLLQGVESSKPLPVKTLEVEFPIETQISHNNNFTDKYCITFGCPDEKIPELPYGYMGNDLFLVIDHSGSMNATIENGNLESGMSIQDVVNHAACTVAKTLQPHDRLGVVIYDSYVEVILELTPMTEINQNLIIQKIRNITPNTQTNIWGAIDRALQLMTTREDKTRNGSIILLTDGIPTGSFEPARGTKVTLERLRNKTNFATSIYTFGFGYQLQKGLLLEIAMQANGSFGHIPDGSMIATNFCNYTATILLTICSNIQIHIKMEDGSSPPIDIINGSTILRSQKDNWYTFDVGTYQLQQDRHIVINTEKDLEFYFTYKLGGKPLETKTQFIGKKYLDKFKDDEIKLAEQSARTDTVSILMQIISNMECEPYKVMPLFELHKSNLKEIHQKYISSKLIKGIYDNWIDQIKISLEKNQDGSFKHWIKWGESYCSALARSLNQEIHANFKDQATMNFGGELFDELVDRSSDIFDKLEPPKPSRIDTLTTSYGSTYRSMSNSSSPAPPSNPPVRMDAFNDRNGGCFHENSKIIMADGSEKLVKNLIPGDYINVQDINGNYSISKIRCILQSIPKFELIEMCQINNLLITPWHPIKYNNEWVFPSSIIEPITVHCKSMFTLLLENDHIGIVNEIPVIMLAHNYKFGVLDHDYYGTDKIVKDMMKMPGWNHGHIILNDNVKYICNKYSGLVEKIQHPFELICSC